MAFVTLDDRPNFAITTLSSGISSVATTIPLSDDSDFPTPSAGYLCVIWSHTKTNPAEDPNREVIRAVNKSGSNLTNCLRGQAGTSASAHSVDDYIMPIFCSKMVDDIENAINEVNRCWLGSWYLEDLAANQSNLRMRLNEASGGADAPQRWIAPRAGSITALVGKSNATITAGSCTFEVVPIGLTVAIDSSNNPKAATASPGTHTFTAGDYIYVRVDTTSDWAPTSSDINAALEIHIT